MLPGSLWASRSALRGGAEQPGCPGGRRLHSRLLNRCSRPRGSGSPGAAGRARDEEAKAAGKARSEAGAPCDTPRPQASPGLTEPEPRAPGERDRDPALLTAGLAPSGQATPVRRISAPPAPHAALARSLPSSLTHTRPATLRSPPGAAVSRNRAPPLLRAQGERRGCGAGGGGPPAPAPAPSPAGRGRARARLGLVVPSAAPPGAHPPQPTSPSMPRGRRALPLGGAVAAVTSAVRPGGPWAGWSSLVN